LRRLAGAGKNGFQGRHRIVSGLGGSGVKGRSARGGYRHGRWRGSAEAASRGGGPEGGQWKGVRARLPDPAQWGQSGLSTGWEECRSQPGRDYNPCDSKGLTPRPEGLATGCRRGRSTSREISWSTPSNGVSEQRAMGSEQLCGATLRRRLRPQRGQGAWGDLSPDSGGSCCGERLFFSLRSSAAALRRGRIMRCGGGRSSREAGNRCSQTRSARI